MQLIETSLYEIGIRGYALGADLASLRNTKARKMRQGQKETWRRLKQCVNPSAERWIWVHAASLGEFEQGRPVIEKLKTLRPDCKILLTFFSPSGYEVRKNYEGADCICYLPMDTLKNAHRFFKAVRPEMAIFVKYEFWRNYLRVMARHGVPTYLISAHFRPDQLFFKRRGVWYRHWLRYFRKIFVQDETSRQLLDKIGVASVIAGDTRFDRVLEIASRRKRCPEAEAFLSAPHDMVFIAGSSWHQDEEIYIEWINSHPGVKCIVAPHEFNPARLAKLKSEFANGAALLSDIRNGTMKRPEDVQTLIIDCFGLLSSLYGYADVAYVGGGFGAGIHNVNEAAVFGIPVLYGPRHDKFLEAEELAACGGGLPVGGSKRFCEHLDRLLILSEERKERGEWAGEYIKNKAGATDIICNNILTSIS